MRSALTGVKGVKSAEVTIGKAVVKIEKGKVTSDQLIAAVNKSGTFKAKVEKTK